MQLKKADIQMMSNSAAIGTSIILSNKGEHINNTINFLSNNISNEIALAAPPTTSPCNLTTVHDCVSYKIEDMNIIDYGLCLASAPACYAGLWASCTWDVCHLGKTYVNPI